MKKTCILALCLLFLGVEIQAQEQVIRMLPGEKWWGAATDLEISVKILYRV